MGIERRRFLGGVAATLVAGATGAQAQAHGGRFYVTTAAMPDGSFEAFILDQDGAVVCSAPMPDRGHGSAWCPRQRCAVVFARRPGTFALVMDAACARVHLFPAPHDRHFYGHGAFSRDGRLLYTSENDLSGERGVIGIWEVAGGYRRVGEFDSGGIGPHDLALSGDGRTLVVANGGILTHPDTGRTKLNLADMDPSLAFLDLGSGGIERQLRLPPALHKLSIRHLALHDRCIGVAMQDQSHSGDLHPLVLLSDGSRLEMLEAPAPVARRMKGYCGDVAMDTAGVAMAVSAPRGGLVTFWSTADGTFLTQTSVPDCCGVAAAGSPGRFLLTSGTGARAVFDLASRRKTMAPASKRRWDNHVLAAEE